MDGQLKVAKCAHKIQRALVLAKRFNRVYVLLALLGPILVHAMDVARIFIAPVELFKLLARLVPRAKILVCPNQIAQ